MVVGFHTCIQNGNPDVAAHLDIAAGGGEEYLILYMAPLNQAKKLNKIAVPSIKSFLGKGR